MKWNDTIKDYFFVFKTWCKRVSKSLHRPRCTFNKLYKYLQLACVEISCPKNVGNNNVTRGAWRGCLKNIEIIDCKLWNNKVSKERLEYKRKWNCQWLLTTAKPFIGSDNANVDTSWLVPVFWFASSVWLKLIEHMPKIWHTKILVIFVD